MMRVHNFMAVIRAVSQCMRGTGGNVWNLVGGSFQLHRLLRLTIHILRQFFFQYKHEIQFNVFLSQSWIGVKSISGFFILIFNQPHRHFNIQYHYDVIFATMINDHALIQDWRRKHKKFLWNSYEL